MDERKVLLQKAQELFLRYGFRSVTMDDISRENGISKKTLYKYVENKEDLIQQVFRNHISCETISIADIQTEASNAVEEMVMIARFMTSLLRKISPSAIYDMKKYYPNLWREREGFHKTHVYEVIKRNLDNGISEGLYRPDMDTDIIAKIYVKKTDVVADEELFPPHEYRRYIIYQEFIKYHMHGILNSKGQIIFDQLIKDI